MLIKKIPPKSPKSKDIPALYYQCDKCLGTLYYFGTAKPDNLHDCPMCALKKEMGEAINKAVGFEVIRNNPNPYRKV